MGMTLIPSNRVSQLIPNMETSLPMIGHDAQDSISFNAGCCAGCVGFIDMVGSTRITSGLCREKMAKYYGIFLNSMTAVVRAFGGIVVKNVGDGLLYHFPSSDNKTDGITECLKCNLALTALHGDLNMLFKGEGLPQLDYRISSDYGEITLARAAGSPHDDIFGPTVNICAKINSFAKPNTAVVGGDLYQISKGMPEYNFHEEKSLVIGNKPYPVYTVLQAKTKSKSSSGISILRL